MKTYKDEVLIHYGIPGMKWGHRKQYQKSTRRERLNYYRQKVSEEQKKRPLSEKSGKLAKKLAKKHNVGWMTFASNNPNDYNLKNSSQWQKDQKTFNKVARQDKKYNNKQLRDADKAAMKATKEKYGKTNLTAPSVKIAGAILAAGAAYGVAKKFKINPNSVGRKIGQIMTESKFKRIDPIYGAVLKRR